LVLTALALCGCRAAAPENALTTEERSAGWELLFDGRTLQGWRGYRQTGVPDGWRVVDGALARVGAGGDLITVEQFGDFDLVYAWRIAPRGNSGLFFHVTEEHESVWQSGPEMQVLDDAGHPDGRNPRTSAGSNYALHAPAVGATRPVGQYNEARLEVRGDRVRHWMNGQLLLEYRLWSPEWQALVAASKFRAYGSYGRARRGHLAIQDHGDPVWFRGIKIRRLDG
jgi:hypothetical protein